MLDLLKYCGEEEEYPELLKPFSNGMYTYATNGHFAVRVPMIDKYKETGAGRNELIDRLLDDVPRNWEEVPVFRLPELAFAPEDDDIPSSVLIISEPVMFDKMGKEHGICLCYLSWILNFENPLISFDCGKEHFSDKAVAFKFNGGEGVVMPMLT